MMLGYPAVRRSSGSPISPTSAALLQSPQSHEAGPSSPRTPTHQISLSRVDEDALDRQATGGSRAPLVARDYSQGKKPKKSFPEGIPASGGRDEQDDGSFVVLSDKSTSDGYSVPIIQAPPPRKSAPRVIPPESVHDTYLSSYIHTLNPESPVRPNPLVRASSAPGTTTADSPSKKLLPSPLDESSDPLQTSGISLMAATPSTGLENKPIFEIFNSELTEDGETIVRVLKGHLEGVLKAQEEVGRMHLALEGMGLEEDGEDGKVEDALHKRQLGVEEIMKRLDGLSDRLRTYHQLGTPKLSFPQVTQPSTAKRTQSIDPATLRPSEVKQFDTTSKLHSSPVSILPSPRVPAPVLPRSNTSVPSSFSPGFGDYLPGMTPSARYRSPSTSNGVSDAREASLSRARGMGLGSLQSESATSLHGTAAVSGSVGIGAGGSRRGSLAPIPDAESERRQPWSNGSRVNLHEALGGSHGSDEIAKRAVPAPMFSQSPMEMVDRSRPW